jgi:hypothetical protein
MPDALEVLENLEALDITVAASAALSDHTYQFVALNREQLMEGKLSTGQDITPSYFDDPYFKTPEAAKKYSDWKDSITPNQKRKKGTPNLYIIGTYHGSIGMEVKDGEYELKSEYKDAASIERKFSNNIYGLDEENAEKLIEGGLEDSFYDKAKQITGL